MCVGAIRCGYVDTNHTNAINALISKAISNDLKDRVDEYLFEPALPMLMVDIKERYPDDKNLQRVSFGLKQRLEKGDDAQNKYIDDYFIIEHDSAKVGKAKITS